MNIELHLDLRTVMVMMAGINLLFAALLALVALHADTVKGARQWAVGTLLLGVAYAAAGLLMSSPPAGILVTLAVILALGLGLMYNGIEAFEDKPCSYRLTIALAAWMALQTCWFTVVREDVQGRIAANWLVYSLVNLACARALFVRIAQPLRTAYWLAAASFLAIAAATMARAAVAIFSPANTVHLFATSTVNPSVFFVASLAQMSLSFALVLMINYRLANDLRQLASTDSLTGLLNRGSLENELSRLAARAERSGEALSVMMIDVDHVKHVNDRFGHPAGDEVLRRLAALMQSLIRRGDYLGRYGGEEFCIVLPGADADDAAALAERLRQRYADLRVKWEGAVLRGTVSIGIADAHACGAAVAPLMAAADRALYRAKEGGRNQVARHAGGPAAPQSEPDSPRVTTA
ncbi:MAG: GGDEF domain-containing protein [Massilia sp.]